MLEITSRARAARDLALERLVGAQSADGSWVMLERFNAMPAAVFIIMLRTTGLIVQAEMLETEAKLLRCMGRYQNPDGGFWKYSGAPSSFLLSQLCEAAIRLALGDVQVTGRPASWQAKNPHLNAEDEQSLRAIIGRSEAFRAGSSGKRTDELEKDIFIFAPMLVAHAIGVRNLPARQRMSMLMTDVVCRMPGLLFLSRRLLHVCTTAAWPATMVLVAGLRSHAEPSRRMRSLATLISGSQEESGGWMLGSLIPMINVMALVRAGYKAADPEIERARAWLIRNCLHEKQEDAFLIFAGSHTCNTGYALDSLLRAGASLDDGSPAWKALNFLLGSQTEEGGCCYGERMRGDAEADSIAHALRAFGMAASLCDAVTESGTRTAMERGAKFSLDRMHSRGGFSCYRRSVLGGHRGSMSVMEQLLFDLPTADVSARIIEFLVDCGMEHECPAIRKTLGFFLRTQCANGAWWSRWWTGYLTGTSFVLRAYAKLGLRHDSPLCADDDVMRRSRDAMARGIDFILKHQSPDGGWGETTAADEDITCAGLGKSSPLLTSHLVSSLLRTGFPATDPVILNAVRFLLDSMVSAGQWNDGQAVFTFIARSSYYSYKFLNLVLPLDALNDFLLAGEDDRHSPPFTNRTVVPTMNNVEATGV